MPEDPSEPQRGACFVLGPAGSGSILLAGALQELGLYGPDPQVPAAPGSSPTATPQWVADLHQRLLGRAGVLEHDARPQAWFETGKVSNEAAVRERVRRFLHQQYRDGVTHLVVRDPRLAWFVGLWHSASVRTEVRATFVTVLRPPLETLARPASGPAAGHPVGRAAGWVNQALHAERATRDTERAFVGFEELVADWTRPLHELGERFGLTAVTSASAADLRRVHALVRPASASTPASWADLGVPTRLAELLEEAWRQLDRLRDHTQDTPQARAGLDELRSAYTAYYAEAEAVSESSALAARRAGPRVDSGTDAQQGSWWGRVLPRGRRP